MCTRYLAAPSSAEIARLFDARSSGAVFDVPEMFPGRVGAVIGRSPDGGLGVAAMRWGFPPPPGVKAPVVNVRNLASPFWRSALANPARRCLVPVSLFSEWGTGAEGKKTLHWFAVTDRPMVAFAGIWRPVPTLCDGQGDPVEEAQPARAFVFLTCEPNPLVGAVHPKAMPVILHAEDHDRWLDAPIAEAVTLAAPFPSQLMTTADPPIS